MRPLSSWAVEAKRHLKKYRPKMANELQQQGKLDEWAQNAANRAIDESARMIESGMSCLEAQSEAKRNHLFLPAEEDMTELGADPNALPDPASLITTPGVNPRKHLQNQKGPKVN
jgi:hypothetical protein